MSERSTSKSTGMRGGIMENRGDYDPSSPTFRLENSPFYLMAHADFKYHEDMDKVLHSTACPSRSIGS